MAKIYKSDQFVKFGGTSSQYLLADGSVTTNIGNGIIGTDTDISNSGAEVVSSIVLTDGVVISHSKRTLTLANLGYTGATNANNYVLPFADNSANWNTAYSWGDHSTQGYITEAQDNQTLSVVVNSLDSDFTISGGNTISFPIGSTQISNAVTAYSWGDHALAGYTVGGNTTIGTSTDIDTSGALVVDTIAFTNGVAVSHSTRTLTLANLGYTGATNANYITNNNQLTNGAGYITAAGNTQLSAEQVEDIMGAAWVSGTNNTFAYDDAAGTLRINSLNTQRSDEEIRDVASAQWVNGTNTTVVKDDANNTIKINVPNAALTGSGTTNKLARWSTSTNIVAGIVVDNGTNVGVGVATPQAKFDVAGAIRIADTATAASAANVGSIRYTTGASSSAMEMVMQTGSTTYEWTEVVSHDW